MQIIIFNCSIFYQMLVINKYLNLRHPNYLSIYLPLLYPSFSISYKYCILILLIQMIFLPLFKIYSLSFLLLSNCYLSIYLVHQFPVHCQLFTIKLDSLMKNYYSFFYFLQFKYFYFIYSLKFYRIDQSYFIDFI